MQNFALIPLVVLALGVLSAGTLLGCFVAQARSTRMIRTLGGIGGVSSARGQVPLLQRSDSIANRGDLMKDVARLGQRSRPERVSLEARFFQAGYLTEGDRRWFFAFRWLCITICPVCLGCVGYCCGAHLAFLASGVGILVGLQIPNSILRRAKQRRDQEIIFYLPLVIDQLVIGVSSSLDIGPCMKWILEMADERDSHNAVTEMFRYAQHFACSGVSLEEALLEVGRLSGHAELKHVLMSLARVTKHGGNITKQLQELASAATAQREARIDGKLKKLELEATGPVGLVFAAFMCTLLVTLGTQMASMLK